VGKIKPPASTIRIVEDFYGEPLSQDVLAKIRETPLDQLLELADRLKSHDLLVAESREFREFSEKSRLKLMEEQRVPREYDQYLKTDLSCNDALILQAGRSAALQSMDELKRMIIYSESFLVPDDTFAWADALLIEDDVGYSLDEKVEGESLARRLNELIPIAPLIRSGHILTVPGRHNFYVGDGSRSIAVDTDLSERVAYRREPMLAWTVVNRLKLIKDWELKSMREEFEPWESMGDELDELAEICIDRLEHGLPTEDFVREVCAYLWPELNVIEIQDLLNFSFITREARTVPVSARIQVLEHLRRSAAVLLPEGDDHVGRAPAAAYSPAVSYRVPALSNTTLEEVINLRLNEDLFAELRQKLVEVVTEVGSSDPSQTSYSSYIASVRTVANDLVRPTYDNLERQRKRATAKNWIWDRSTSGAVSLGINGIARILGVPATLSRGPAGTIGKGVGKISTKKSRRQQKDLEVAGAILVSLLD
jgi:hypothetical protein